jgi:hypothetical protein
MISQRQIDFRQEYRSRILGWYDGYLHVVIIYAMGAAAFYIYVAHIHNVTALEWLTVPLTFLFTNGFEWAVHKFIMHRPVDIKGLRAIYERHTLNHHQFFTDEEMRFRDPKDWRVTVLCRFPRRSYWAWSRRRMSDGCSCAPPRACILSTSSCISAVMWMKTGLCGTPLSPTRCAGITPPTTTRGS